MAVTGVVGSYLDTAKGFWNNFSLQKWAESIGGSSAEAVIAAVYFSVSFLLGFIFKKYFKILFVCVILTIISIKMLEYRDFLIIDWNAIETWLGWGKGEPISLNVLFDTFFDWLKDHLLVAISSAIGFLVGYKLG
jgi:uncharacterized membrane protein (Fun14 family)